MPYSFESLIKSAHVEAGTDGTGRPAPDSTAQQHANRLREARQNVAQPPVDHQREAQQLVERMRNGCGTDAEDSAAYQGKRRSMNHSRERSNRFSLAARSENSSFGER